MLNVVYRTLRYHTGRACYHLVMWYWEFLRMHGPTACVALQVLGLEPQSPALENLALTHKCLASWPTMRLVEKQV